MNDRDDRFRHFLIHVPVLWDSPEWGFPKGKRNKNESAICCAKREMLEETCVTQDKYIIRNDIDIVRESFYGTDNKKYLHTYFVAQVTDNNFEIPKVDEHNVVQTREVSAAKWGNMEDISKLFRPYNVEKLQVIENLNQLLCRKFRIW